MKVNMFHITERQGYMELHPVLHTNSWTMVRYADLPMSTDALKAALAPWRKEGYFHDFEFVPRQLLIDLGLIRE